MFILESEGTLTYSADNHLEGHIFPTQLKMLRKGRIPISVISSYQVRRGKTTTEFRDSLTKTQKQILNLRGISSVYYWGQSVVQVEKSGKT